MDIGGGLTIPEWPNLELAHGKAEASATCQGDGSLGSGLSE